MAEFEFDSVEERESFEAYMAEDPVVLSEDQLASIGEQFGLPLEEMTAIASGMTEMRRIVREQYEYEEEEKDDV